jgi:protoporphyrin/coproporphyrin ferrochelatase
MKGKRGVLLINLGTPDSPKPRDVFRYLNEFLTDKHIIDLPFVWRQLLVRGIIVPKRYKMSARTYKQIWTTEGSPLLLHTRKQKQLLQEALGDEFYVEIAMRYQNPSIASALKALEKISLQELIVIPLFPQYAAATTGSICEKVFSLLKQWRNFPALRMVNDFYHHPTLIHTFATIAQQYDVHSYDHLVFSFHGLPEEALKKAHPQGPCLKSASCCRQLCAQNRSCYGAQCYATARAIADQLNLSQEHYTVCFQSRLGNKPWIAPFTSDVIKQLPHKGAREVLVLSPAFVCDCLETLYEIEIEYQAEFIAHGGTSLTLMEGLNAHPLWIQTLKELVLAR